jgi:hypothetical protein
VRPGRHWRHGQPGVGDSAATAPPTRRWLQPSVWLSAAIVLCALYANLSFFVSRSTDYRYFPPFRPHVNVNGNTHLGGEYYKIAESLVRGEGFSHPFDRPTGPTAWQPPVLPSLLAVLLWGSGGNRNAVMAVVVCLQVEVLILTGLLVLRLARPHVGPIVCAAVFFAALLCNFHLCFQTTHDSWLVLLALDGLLAGLCWWRPLDRWPAAFGWGAFGGVCVLINPIVGFAWGVLSLALGFRSRAWSRLGVAMLAAALTLMPWIVRNYLVFGRFIPSKSNLAYELYQSQCLQRDGLLQGRTFSQHPFGRSAPERKEYNALGETAYLDRKWEQFWQAVRNDPADFMDRVTDRFLGATLWFVPMDRNEARGRPWVHRLSRLIHPLAFLSLVVLLVTSLREPLDAVQWIAIGVYVLYLLPYVAASYYERYGLPLIGVKVLLILWATERLCRGLFSALGKGPVPRPSIP